MWSRGLKGVQTLIRNNCWSTCCLPQNSCTFLFATTPYCHLCPARPHEVLFNFPLLQRQQWSGWRWLLHGESRLKIQNRGRMCVQLCPKEGVNTEGGRLPNPCLPYSYLVTGSPVSGCSPEVLHDSSISPAQIIHLDLDKCKPYL